MAGKNDDLKLKNLNQFNGTTKYINVLGFNCTDGIGYIMQNGYSWFVTDFLAVAMYNKKVRNEPFVSVNLKLNGTKGQMIVTDGNGKVLYKQDYKYTDAKRELLLFFVNNVLMLNNEY